MRNRKGDVENEKKLIGSTNAWGNCSWEVQELIFDLLNHSTEDSLRDKQLLTQNDTIQEDSIWVTYRWFHYLNPKMQVFYTRLKLDRDIKNENRVGSCACFETINTKHVDNISTNVKLAGQYSAKLSKDLHLDFGRGKFLWKDKRWKLLSVFWCVDAVTSYCNMAYKFIENLSKLLPFCAFITLTHVQVASI